MRSRTAGLISAVTLLALGAAACSSNSTTDVKNTATTPTGASTTGASSSPAASGTPLVIGTIGSYSGPNASSESGAQKSIDAWARWTNAHGGIAGHPVKLTIIDDGGDAAKATTGVRKLISQEHVIAIVGPVSNFDVQWASIASKAGVPVLGGLSLDLPYDTDPNFYPSGANAVAMINGALTLGKKSGTKFGDIYCAESPVCAAGGALYGAVAATLGMSVPVKQGAAASSPSFTSVCQALKSAAVDAYTLSISGAVLVRIADECKKQGLKATLVLTDGVVTPALLTHPGTQNLLSAEINAPFFDSSIPALRDYRDALKQYASSIVGTGEDNPIALYAWAGGQLLAAAVQASGAETVTSASIKEGLYKLKDETLGGLAPPLNFTPGKPAHINCTFTVGIKDGKFTTPYGLKTTTCVSDALVTKVLSGGK